MELYKIKKNKKSFSIIESDGKKYNFKKKFNNFSIENEVLELLQSLDDDFEANTTEFIYFNNELFLLSKWGLKIESDLQ